MTLNPDRHRQLGPLLQIGSRALAFSGNGIVILDATTASNPIIFANDAFCRMTGHAIEVSRWTRFFFFTPQSSR